jgi:DegV family protein with EDD domain
VICLCVSGEVSATYGAAVVAADMYPDRDITVVDTRTLTMAQGFMALAAAEAVEADASKEEAIARARSVGERSHVYAALSTVKYMAMSGRIGNLAAGMATVLNVKPVLAVKDAKLDLLERVRTRKRAWARVIELTEEALAGRPIERMAIVHVYCEDDARQFEEQVRASLPCPDEIVLAELSAGLSVHSGAGLLGIVAVHGE